MSQLSDFAEEYGFSLEAVESVMRSLQQTKGQAAQFNHPELGGMGQWMPTMIMIGDMNNHALKARINDLCHTLASHIQATDHPTRPSSPFAGMWWPPQLRHPTQSGGNDQFQYAYFEDQHCIAIKVGQEVNLYDTAPYQIRGISVQNYGTSLVLEFQTADGLIVTLSQFKSL